MANLLHGDEAVFAGAGYIVAKQREEIKDPKVTWYIAVSAVRGRLAGR